MDLLPKVLCSNVLRSRQQNGVHGGLHLVDLNKASSKDVLSWDKDVDWGDAFSNGDKGCRGLCFFNDLLYMTAAKQLYAFNQNYEIIGEYKNQNLDGTHQICQVDGKIYCVANVFDSILEFDCVQEKWTRGFQFDFTGCHHVFDPEERQIPKSDLLHLDSVTVRDGILWTSGSQTDKLYGVSLAGYNRYSIQLRQGCTHDCQWHPSGFLVYNLSKAGETWTDFGYCWKTPMPWAYTAHNDDFARINYTRGMAIYHDYIIVGTSPARLYVYEVGRTTPLVEVNISSDVRNSICGICLVPDSWEK